MADLKKSLIQQVDNLLRKGEIKESQYRTLITKIELASPKFLEMALNKFETVRKSMKEEEEKVTKAGETPAPTPTPTPTPPQAAAKPAAPASAPTTTGTPGGIGVGTDTAGMGVAGTHT